MSSDITHPKKIWVAKVKTGIDKALIYPTSIRIDIEEDVDDVIEKFHKKLHVQYKDRCVTELFLYYPRDGEPPIKRDVKVIDALKRAQELGVPNSIDAPFFVLLKQ